MKKILAITLAVLMLAAMAVPAFAAEQEQVFTEGEDVLPQAGDVVVTYGVAQSYIVTIPQDVAFDEENLTDTRSLSVSNVKIRGTEMITVAIDSLYDYKLVDTNQKSVDVDYSIATSTYTLNAVDATENTEKTLADGDVALTVYRADGNEGPDNATEGAVTLTFATTGTAQQGNYKDTLTFTIDVVEKDGLLATDDDDMTVIS